ncbi:hypothetical protein BJV82DRAFT_716111 [Fennellomyces sp. T-0311]|nr:hypothetical protein BJV82DRAFT_716111 [Fennellomyces sp. T-0311]
MHVADLNSLSTTSPCFAMTCQVDNSHHEFKKHLDLTATQDAFYEGLKSYASHNYKQAIKFYIRALNALESDLLAVIRLHYAAACEMDQKYNRGFEDYDDSERSQTPSIPNILADTASLIVRDDKLEPFFRIDTKGLETTRTYYKPSKHSENFHNDLQKPHQWQPHKLPFEMVTQVLSHLPLKSRVQLAMTCRSWYSFIMSEWDEMWSTIDFTRDKPSSKPPATQQLLQAISSNQVRKVKMDMNNMPELVPEILDNEDISHGQGGLISAIKQLNWDKIGWLDIANPKKALFCDILEFSKGTLRSLDIHSNGNSDYCTEALVDAAQICPDLRSIRNYVTASYSLPRYIVSTSLPPADLHLTQLTLSFSMPPETLLHLLKSSPHLMSLTVYPQDQINCATLLETVHTYCDMLQELKYKHFNDKCLSMYSRPVDVPEGKGLKCLELQVSCHASEGISIDRILCKIIENNSTTLETLNLNLESINGSDHESLRILEQCSSPRLHTLTLSQQMGSTFDYHRLTDLIASCASLTSVTLNGAYFWHDNVLRALGNPRLRELNMYLDHDNMDERSLDDGQGTITIRGMQELLDRACNLLNLSFGYNYYFPSPLRLPNTFAMDLAKLIGAHPNIRIVDIQDVPMQNGQLIGIMDQLKNSQVRKLYMELDCHVYIPEIEALALPNHLEYLYLHDACDTFRKHKLIQLFERCASERFLYVEVTNENTSNVLKGCKGTSRSSNDDSSKMYYIEGEGFDGYDDTDSSESSDDYDDEDEDEDGDEEYDIYL